MYPVKIFSIFACAKISANQFLYRCPFGPSSVEIFSITSVWEHIPLFVLWFQFGISFSIFSFARLHPDAAAITKNELYVCVFCSNKMIVRKICYIFAGLKHYVFVCMHEFSFAPVSWVSCFYSSFFNRIPTKWILNVIDEGENVLVPHCHSEE